MAAGEGVVQRKRLFDLVSGPRRLRVVVAPSGFGKTTLLQGWVDVLPADERTVVWVALSAEVGTRRDFWQIVVASAIRRGELDATAHRVVISRLEADDDPVPALAEFLDGRGPTLLVIDAYEHLRDLTALIDDDVVRLVTAVDGLDVVVTTRTATHLSDDVLVMRGLVRVIDDTDLRFTADEVVQLLELHAPQAVAVADQVLDDTMGYPLGVRAAAFALGRIGDTPSVDSTAWQRLVTEDLKSQISDPVLVEFVLDTSIPPYFDSELARHLTGGGDVGGEVDAALAELAWNGFGRWIPYAGERPVFQYVESVRDVFSARLRTDQPDRHRRDAGIAAAWLHRNGDHDLALALAIDAHHFELATSICRSLVISNPDIYTTDRFERHLRRVPRKLLPRYPGLALVRAMAYASNAATRGSAAEYFRIAAAHSLDGIDRLSPSDAFQQHIGRQMSLRYLGRSEEAGEAAEAALEILDSLSGADLDGLGEFLPMALTILAYSRFQVGDIDRAGTLAERAATSAVIPWWRNYALGFVVGIHALNGRGSDARAGLSMTDPAAWSGDERRIPHSLGLTGHAALLLDEFDFEGALHAYDSDEWIVDLAESWPFITWVLMHARLGLGGAGPEARRVEAALAMKPARPGLGANLGTAALLNALAILWLADGRAAKAGALLRTATSYPGQLAPGKLLHQLVTGDPVLAVHNVAGLLDERGHTVRSAMAVDTLGAAAAMRAGSPETALELLERAASRYQLFGVRTHLMYVPLADLAALRDLASADRSAVSQRYLAGPVPSPITLAESVPARLTPREIEVLRVWAQYRTRAEVAEVLFVSANTVRSQLNSAYRKLGVTTKDAAIQRAIELDLLQHPHP